MRQIESLGRLIELTADAINACKIFKPLFIEEFGDKHLDEITHR